MVLVLVGFVCTCLRKHGLGVIRPSEGRFIHFVLLAKNGTLPSKRAVLKYVQVTFVEFATSLAYHQVLGQITSNVDHEHSTSLAYSKHQVCVCVWTICTDVKLPFVWLMVWFVSSRF